MTHPEISIALGDREETEGTERAAIETQDL